MYAVEIYDGFKFPKVFTRKRWCIHRYLFNVIFYTFMYIILFVPI